MPIHFPRHCCYCLLAISLLVQAAHGLVSLTHSSLIVSGRRLTILRKAADPSLIVHTRSLSSRYFSTSPTTTLGEGSVKNPLNRHNTTQSRGSPPQQTTPRPYVRRKNRDTKKYTIRQLYQRAKELERKGEWRKAVSILHDILQNLDPADAHSHLALARLEARRAPQDDPSRALEAFENGTQACPESIHLWHAYAHYQQSRNQLEHARELYERALEIDGHNPYVCHAYGLLLMEEHKRATMQAVQHSGESSAINSANAATMTRNNSSITSFSAATDTAIALWERALTKTSTSALVCSLGEAFIARQQYADAQRIYAYHVSRVHDARERMEIYLAASWLEERYFQNYTNAEALLQKGVKSSPTSSVAQVALARFEGRRSRIQQQPQQQQEEGSPSVADESSQQITLKRLASACVGNGTEQTQPVDGRVYNAWANMEVKRKGHTAARKILQAGLALYPEDYSLLQAAGKVEERLGNFSGARDLYGASLRIEPSAPTIVAYALLDIRHPLSSNRNLTKSLGLFEEALLVDPRHGPAYNAYARTVFQKLGDADRARAIYKRGVAASCPDAASIYHGYAMLEIWLGNIDQARSLLLKGREEASRQDSAKDYVHRERAVFVSHTLGMLELNRNHPSDALEVFHDGLTRYGNSSQLLLGAALSEVMLGSQHSARAMFERSTLADAKHAQAWQAWGVMEMRAGNIARAKSLFECGIKNTPHHGALWQAYATMESRLGNVEAARALFDSGVKKAPRHIPLYQSWAFMEFREGNFVEAKALISKALTRDKRNGSGWLIYAKIEDQMGNDGLAHLLLRRGIECAPDMPELYCALGDMLARRQKISDARQIYEKGIEVDPMYAPLYHSLAELEAQVFNLDGLARLNHRAKSVFNSNALTPTAASSFVFGDKIKTRRARNVPLDVTALTERIVVEDPVGNQAASSTGNLNDLGSNLLEEDGRVGRLLAFEDNESLEGRDGA